MVIFRWPSFTLGSVHAGMSKFRLIVDRGFFQEARAVGLVHNECYCANSFGNFELPLPNLAHDGKKAQANQDTSHQKFFFGLPSVERSH